MANIEVYAPTQLKWVKKGRMIMFYDPSLATAEKPEGEHVCSFFHEHKAMWAAKCFADAGVKVIMPSQKSNGAKKIRRIKK